MREKVVLLVLFVGLVVGLTESVEAFDYWRAIKGVAEDAERLTREYIGEIQEERKEEVQRQEDMKRREIEREKELEERQRRAELEREERDILGGSSTPTPYILTSIVAIGLILGMVVIAKNHKETVDHSSGRVKYVNIEDLADEDDDEDEK